ncbi:hypothetical protein VTI28DRAFT_1330 [Corynascus sepedonium]
MLGRGSHGPLRAGQLSGDRAQVWGNYVQMFRCCGEQRAARPKHGKKKGFLARGQVILGPGSLGCPLVCFEEARRTRFLDRSF